MEATDRSQSRTSALLPCPFCGEPPTRADRTDNYTPTKHVWFIFCYCGGLSANAHQFGATEAEVIEKWNRRSTPSESERSMTTTYWMIERNSKHKNMPPNEHVMWFRERQRFAQGDKDIWTPHADRAMRFSTKAAADEYLGSFGGEDYDPLPDVTEHMDCAGPTHA